MLSLVNIVYKRCAVCGLIASYLDTGEPLNAYLVSLGYQRNKSSVAYHGACFKKLYPGVTPEEVLEAEIMPDDEE